jgi:hypothetical protein
VFIEYKAFLEGFKLNTLTLDTLAKQARLVVNLTTLKTESINAIVGLKLIEIAKNPIGVSRESVNIVLNKYWRHN